MVWPAHHSSCFCFLYQLYLLNGFQGYCSRVHWNSQLWGDQGMSNCKKHLLVQGRAACTCAKFLLAPTATPISSRSCEFRLYTGSRQNSVTLLKVKDGIFPNTRGSNTHKHSAWASSSLFKSSVPPVTSILISYKKKRKKEQGGP